MKTIADILTLSAAYLTEHQIEHARRSAEELLSAVLHMKRIDLYMQYDRPLIESEIEMMRAYVKRSSRQEPIEYITGSVDFYGCQISISPDVLIPRKETEILVDHVIKTINGRSGVLWDLCTGSGCIGLAMKKANTALSVILSDICPKALAVAQKNAVDNQLSVTVREGDLLQPYAGEKADFITCNPPYIAKSEFETLDRSVRDFEPKQALLAGEKGVEFYEKLARELPPFLQRGALVFLEIGSTQGKLVQEIFEGGPWRKKTLLPDWAGLPRFFFLENE